MASLGLALAIFEMLPFLPNLGMTPPPPPLRPCAKVMRKLYAADVVTFIRLSKMVAPSGAQGEV